MEQWFVYTAAAGRRRVPMVTKGYQRIPKVTKGYQGYLQLFILVSLLY